MTQKATTKKKKGTSLKTRDKKTSGRVWDKMGYKLKETQRVIGRGFINALKVEKNMGKYQLIT